MESNNARVTEKAKGFNEFIPEINAGIEQDLIDNKLTKIFDINVHESYCVT